MSQAQRNLIILSIDIFRHTQHLPTLLSQWIMHGTEPGILPDRSAPNLPRLGGSHVICLLANDRETCPRFHPTVRRSVRSQNPYQTLRDDIKPPSNCSRVIPSPPATAEPLLHVTIPPQVPCPSSGPKAAFLAFCTTMYVYTNLTRGHASTADPPIVGREFGVLRVHRKHRTQAS
jgi:hypothetical protein